VGHPSERLVQTLVQVALEDGEILNLLLVLSKGNELSVTNVVDKCLRLLVISEDAYVADGIESMIAAVH
jgi:hypothetical protein